MLNDDYLATMEMRLFAKKSKAAADLIMCQASGPIHEVKSTSSGGAECSYCGMRFKTLEEGVGHNTAIAELQSLRCDMERLIAEVRRLKRAAAAWDEVLRIYDIGLQHANRIMQDRINGDYSKSPYDATRLLVAGVEAEVTKYCAEYAAQPTPSSEAREPNH